MRLSEFFEHAGTKNIVINTDIDGFLSGMILQKYYDCKIVGFSNSRESIWLTPEIPSILSPVYIDIFVNRARVHCIDQHIVAYNNRHIDQLLSYGTKLNPNLDISRRAFQNIPSGETYYKKYPFGTVHYLISLMQMDGIDVEFNDLYTTKEVIGIDHNTYSIQPGQVLLRADDALYSSLGPYRENANEWWDRLSQSGSQMINRMIAYKNNCNVNRNDEYKTNIGNFFQNGLGCDGKDGAFFRVTAADGHTLQRRILNYKEKICYIMGHDLTLPETLEEYRGEAKLGGYTQETSSAAVTYAFVRGPGTATSNRAFSYTTFLRRIDT